VEDGAERRIKELGHWHEGREGGGKEGGREGGRGGGREEGRTLSEYCSLSCRTEPRGGSKSSVIGMTMKWPKGGREGGRDKR